MGWRRIILLLVGAAALLLAGLWLTQRSHDAAPPAPPPAATPTARLDARATADRVLAALQARDGAALAALVHPDGVRLSPSAYVDVDADQRLHAPEVAALWRDTAVRTWGHAEGSGDAIDLTPAEYAVRYILDHDYAGAQVSINGDTARGTTVDNSATVYPGATRVEYFRPGTGDMDWSALRLVLAPVDGEWRLVGIIHDAWAP